jgi:hypothetical protein
MDESDFHALKRQAFAMGLVTIGMLLSPPQANVAEAMPVIQQSTAAHLELQKTLDAIVSTRPQMMQTLESRDLEMFRSRVTKIQEALAASRIALDNAVLTGDWKTPEKKRKAVAVADAMQGAQILSVMTVAISTGYEYPTQKVPDSAADAAVRLFDRLEKLAAAVKALNANPG